MCSGVGIVSHFGLYHGVFVWLAYALGFEDLGATGDINYGGGKGGGGRADRNFEPGPHSIMEQLGYNLID